MVAAQALQHVAFLREARPLITLIGAGTLAKGPIAAAPVGTGLHCFVLALETYLPPACLCTCEQTVRESEDVQKQMLKMGEAVGGSAGQFWTPWASLFILARTVGVGAHLCRLLSKD